MLVKSVYVNSSLFVMSCDTKTRISGQLKGNRICFMVLTDEQEERVRMNRENALRKLKRKREDGVGSSSSSSMHMSSSIQHRIKLSESQYVYDSDPLFKDSGAGFIYPSKVKKEQQQQQQKTRTNNQKHEQKHQQQIGMDDDVECDVCGEMFETSFLRTNFNVLVCSSCRNAAQETGDDYALITKTDARERFLLSEGELERELRYVERKNPVKASWNAMKMFLTSQVQGLAYTKYGGPEGLEEEFERRENARQARQQKKFKKELSALRRVVTSKGGEDVTVAHIHSFNGEVKNTAGDYEKTCSECGITVVFEKM